MKSADRTSAQLGLSAHITNGPHFAPRLFVLIPGSARRFATNRRRPCPHPRSNDNLGSCSHVRSQNKCLRALSQTIL